MNAEPGVASLGGALIEGLLWAAAFAAVAFGALRFFRRRLPGRGRSALMEVLAQAAVGPRRSILVVRALDRLLVIGVTDGGMTVLTESDAPVDAADGGTGRRGGRGGEAGAPGAFVVSPAGRPFGRALRAGLHRLSGPREAGAPRSVESSGGS